MRQYVADSHIRNGRPELDNVPFSDDVEVRIFVVPKVRLSEMSFTGIRELTRAVKGNLSDDIDRERGETSPHIVLGEKNVYQRIAQKRD